MKILRTMALGAALIVGVSAAAPAQATQPGTRPEPGSGTTGPRKERMRGHGARALFRGITLTDAQRQRVREIRNQYRPQMEALRDRRKAARAESGDQRQRPDSATLAQFRTLAERQHADLRAVLTTDQQKVFDQNLTRIQERRQEMRKERRGDRRQLRPGLR
jgi:Spy/CpxP family protein refolding chaperone